MRGNHLREKDAILHILVFLFSHFIEFFLAPFLM
jgi:hypothetical protein